MFNTFNMGIGMVLVCAPEEVDGIIGQLKGDGYPSYVIGRVGRGTGGVVFIR
jgi:phosphoribosylformylglycinamidine cyclo-ligase